VETRVCGVCDGALDIASHFCGRDPVKERMHGAETAKTGGAA
jgi:hypothetical protein